MSTATKKRRHIAGGIIRAIKNMDGNFAVHETPVQLLPAGRERKMGGPVSGASKVANQEREPDTTTFSGRLGANLRRYRKRAGLSQEALATRLRDDYGLEITSQSLSHYETGKRSMQVDDLPAFAQALGITIRRLLPDA